MLSIPTHTSPLPQHIAIVDDNIGTAQDTFEIVCDLGFSGEIIQRNNNGFSNIQQLMGVLPPETTGVLCDHRLQSSGFASFFGSELVAELSSKRMASVLITQFTEMDADTSIRLYRKQIPVLLKRDDLNLETLHSSLFQSQSELIGNIPLTRIPYRTLVRIINFTQADSYDVVDAFIPSWNPRTSIRFPTDLIKDIEITKEIRTRFGNSSDPIRVFARVNVGAENAEDIFLENFEWTAQ